jgi:hypothetical protein
MKIAAKFIFVAISTILVLSCSREVEINKTEISGNNEITVSGIIQPQGATSYMYGTHILRDSTGKTIYALESKLINLDAYAGKSVCVIGKLITGYPVDGGPGYLEVTKIKQ